MKKYIYISLALFFFGCQKEKTVVPELDDLIKEYREDDAIKLEVSTESITLDPLKKREQALLVTWEPLEDIEQLYPVTYLFKIDLTEKNFSTSVSSEKIEEGTNYKIFTHDELDNLIRQTWGRKENDPISISVRVIAQVASDEKFIMPLYSTKEVHVKPLNIESSPLFLYGSAVQSDNSNNMVELEEYKNGDIYTWRGHLNAGECKIATVMGESYPAYVKGEDEQTLRFAEEEGDDEGFHIDKDGTYAIIIDRINKKISIEEVTYLDLYFGGSATPTAWQSPTKVEWDPFQPNVCSVTLPLEAGECKFSLEPNFSAGTAQIRPIAPDASIQEDLDVMISNNNPDWKWKIQTSEAGTYKVVLDVKSMKAEFIKLD